MVRRAIVRKAQISFEYLIIVGMALLVIVPALLFFLQMTGGSDVIASSSRVNQIGLEMVERASSAYALGKYAWLTLEVNVPDVVQGFYVAADSNGNNELIIRYNSKYGLVDAVFFPGVTITNATDTIGTSGEHLIAPGRPGVMHFKFLSQGANVSINETS